MTYDVRRYCSRLGPTVGWTLIFVWCLWWTYNIFLGRMVFAEYTWFHIPAFGVDFQFHVDKPVRIWLAGGDPYEDKGRMFSYPPVVLRLYAWVALTTPSRSLAIWMISAAICAVIGAVAATCWRTSLGLQKIPGSLGVAMILFSTPVLFAIERANYDLLIVPCIVAAALLMRKRSESANVIAAFLLAIAIWAKLYPGLLLFALLALRRWNLLAWTVGWSALVGLLGISELQRFNENSDIVVSTAYNLARAYPAILPWNHPLSAVWVSFWHGKTFEWVPGGVGAALFILPLVGWVSWHVFQSPRRDALILPFMFWIVAAGTYAPPVSNDYNLVFLPLAILATWKGPQEWKTTLTVAALALWWQPIDLSIPGPAILLVKMAGVVGAGAILVNRARESSADTEPLLRTDLPRLGPGGEFVSPSLLGDAASAAPNEVVITEQAKQIPKTYFSL